MVSLTFGAINSLSSRSFLQDDEDQASNTTTRTYDVELKVAVDACQTLVICTCKQSKAFSETYLLGKDASVVADIKEQTVEKDTQGESIGKRTETIGTVSSVREGEPKDMLVLKLNSGLDGQFVNDLSSKILLTFNPATVIILESSHMVSFKSDDPELRDEIQVTRCLFTQGWKEGNLAPTLDRPNVIGGISASVLSECEFKSIPAILILNYVDTPSTVDTLTLEGFRKTFFSTKQAIQLKGVIPIKDSGNILKSISKRINGDDLYL